MPDYHHTVNLFATPNGEFQATGPTIHNFRMTTAKKADIRRANLRRLIIRDFQSNQSALAEKLGSMPSYVNDLLRLDAKKSFGEKAAHRIEIATDLLDGQLDIPDSPLTKRTGLPDAEKIIKGSLQVLSAGEKNEIAAHVNEILGRRRRLKQGT